MADKNDDEIQAGIISREQTLQYWLEAVASAAGGSAKVSAMEATLSWRITKPLRLVSAFRKKVAQLGLLRTMKMSVKKVRSLLARRGSQR